MSRLWWLGPATIGFVHAASVGLTLPFVHRIRESAGVRIKDSTIAVLHSPPLNRFCATYLFQSETPFTDRII